MDASRQQQSECLNRVHEMTRVQISRGVQGLAIMDHAGADFVSLEDLRAHDVLPQGERDKLIAFIEKDRLAHTFVLMKLPREKSYECHVLQLACPESVRHAYHRCHEEEEKDGDEASEEEKK